MSNDITLFSNVPAHVRDAELSDATKALMGNANSGKRISIKGGVFRLMAGGKEVAQIEDRHMDVIIAAAAPHVARQYYSEGYDPDAQAQAPDCWSNDGEKPDPSSKNKQADQCSKCPQNIAGSGRGESRACRYQQRLALLLPDDLEAGVHALAVPATSIFGKADGDKRPLKEYVTYLRMQTKPVNVDALVTRMKFDTKAEHGKLFFSPVRWVTDEEYAVIKTAAASEEAKRAITMTVTAIDKAGEKSPQMDLPGDRPDAASAPKEEAKPKKASKPKAEAAETPVDEPEKRKAPAKADAAVPEKPSKLADIVGAWDDED